MNKIILVLSLLFSTLFVSTISAQSLECADCKKIPAVCETCNQKTDSEYFSGMLLKNASGVTIGRIQKPFTSIIARGSKVIVKGGDGKTTTLQLPCYGYTNSASLVAALCACQGSGGGGGSILLTTVGAGAATLTGSVLNIPTPPATTNTLTAATEQITSTVNSVAATLSPAAGTIAKNIGFDAAGNLVKQAATAASGVLKYDAGNGSTVMATGAGVTFTRTAANSWVFAIPSGVELLSYRIYSTSAQFPGTNVGILFDYTGNTLTNQGYPTAAPPNTEGWNMQAAVYNNAANGGSTSTNLRTQITTVTGGDITVTTTLGSFMGTGETLLTGRFN